MALSYNEKAAQLMEHLCNHDSHGYSQPNRKGTGEADVVLFSKYSFRVLRIAFASFGLSLT